jgi:hypothetical protein
MLHVWSITVIYIAGSNLMEMLCSVCVCEACVMCAESLCVRSVDWGLCADCVRVMHG